MTQARSVKIDLGHNGTRALKKAWLSWGDPRLAEHYIGPTTCSHGELCKGQNKRNDHRHRKRPASNP